jgi:hypothetical protein
MLTTRPPTTAILNVKPLQDIDGCLPPLNTPHLEADWFEKSWVNVYMGFHEGMDVQSTSVRFDMDLNDLGLFVATKASIAGGLLDFCIRRGFDISKSNYSHNELNTTILSCALGVVHYTKLHTVVTFCQVLADAYVQISPDQPVVEAMVQCICSFNEWFSSTPEAKFAVARIVNIFNIQISS